MGESNAKIFFGDMQIQNASRRQICWTLTSREEEISACLGLIQALCPNNLSKIKLMTGSVGKKLGG